MATTKSKPKSTGLGRGLGDLLQLTDHELKPDAAAVQTPPPEGAYFAELSITAIKPNAQQPRSVFDEEELAVLAESIAEVGILEPIVVRPLESGEFELVMGERRLRAASKAGLEVVPAIVRKTEDHDMLRDALLENIHRVQLNPLEEAAAYQQMISDFGLSQEELSKRIKRSRPQISNTIRLLQLPPAVQRRVAVGVLSAGHARALLALSDTQAIESLANRIVSEGLSVRSVEEIVAITAPESRKSPKTTGKAKTKQALKGAEQIVQELENALETRVRVSGGLRGRIIIDYAGVEDLERIAAVIAGANRGLV